MRNYGKCNTSQIWASIRENQSSGVANNTSANQPAHPRSLVDAFVIHFFGEFHILTCFERKFTILASHYSRGDWFESHLI